MVKGLRMATGSNGFMMQFAGGVAPGDFRAGRIVVLFDETEQDHGLVSVLQNAGYQVDVCTQLDRLKLDCETGYDPVAIILDRVFEKGEDELALNLARIRSQYKNSLPLIFISTQTGMGIRLAAYRSGATHYLAKPLDKDGLLRLLGELEPLMPAQRYRVLLVEDKSDELEEHAGMLRLANMDVRATSDPLLVMDILENFAADVLVLDLEMQTCSGHELAIILHDVPRFAAIPVVYLSRESRLLLEIQAINNSNENYLSKLASPSHLIDVIGKHARSYRRNLDKAEILRSTRYELERQQQALDAHAIVSATDLYGNIIYVNEKFCQISGYSRAELLDKNHRIIKSGQHPAELYAGMWHTISGGSIWQGEVCNRCKNGDLYWVYTSIVPFLDTNGLPYQYISVRTDITHVKKNEIALLKAKEAAEAGSRAKSEFLASMSHELRTPLNAILGFSQLFTIDEHLPQKTRDNARQIEQAGQYLLSLVNDLIDLARIESNKMELSLEAVKVENVMNQSISMVKSMAYSKGVKVALAQSAEMGIMVMADFNRLRQSLINLLTNAIKYNKLQGTVQMACKIIDGRAHIAVTDSGAGIPAEMQGRIFTAFDRLGEERGEVEGTGIGLVITKRIIEAMGGTIGFESRLGQGSTFWVELPLAYNAERAERKPGASGNLAANINTAHMHAGKPAVLYIEDNQMNLRLMQQIFAGRKEWELRCAKTAESGIEEACAIPPDLILMDINLPGMDGYQALARLKSCPETAHIPVVALTANAMKGDSERGLEAGFTDYLSKPLDILKLLGLLEKLLD